MNERRSFQNGITLIALVISIIVMLILAGVSLNATIGDNGIITQAQNATYMQSVAVLEEFMQEQYIKLYGTTENSNNKMEYFVKDINGSRKYIQKAMNNNYFFMDSSSGNTYYFIEKSELPEEIRNQIKGGDNSLTNKTIWADFNDIYGITSDLKVYYCESTNENRIGATDEAIKADKELSKPISGMSKGSDWAKALGLEKDVTYKDLLNVTELNITNSNLDLKLMYNLGSLKRLTFSNVNINNLDGIGSAVNLNYLFFDNSKIENYKDIENCTKLQRLYLYFPSTMNEEEANKQIENLCDENIGIANADLKNLEYFGIFGKDYFSDRETDFSWIGLYALKSNVTNITPIEKLKSKKYIKYLYLNNNKISTIECLRGFENLYLLLLTNNSMLNNLEGLQNLQKLTYLYAQYCDLYNTKGLENCTSLYYLKLTKNSNLTTLNGLENSKNLTYIYAEECSLGKNEDINYSSEDDSLKCINGLENVTELYLAKNDIKRVEYLKNFKKINKLYLEGNENINGESLLSIKNVIYKCGDYISISSKYSLLVLDENTTNLSLKSQNINKENFILLKNKSKIEKLDLTNLNILDNAGNELSQSETDNLINEVLSTLNSVKYLNLENISKLHTISFVKNMPNLVEIVLYGTNVVTGTLNENGEYNGLELLNDNLKLENLALDNENIELIKILETLNRIKDGYIYSPNRFLEISGLYVKNAKMFESLNKPNLRLEKLGLKCIETDKVIDLSKCTSLKKVTLIYGSGNKVQLPDSVEEIYLDGQYIYGKYPNSLKKVRYINQGLTEEVLSNLAKNCPYLEEIATGNSNRGLNSLDGFENASFKNSLKVLNLTGNDRSEKSPINNIRGISGYSKLETLSIYRANISDLSGIETLTNLKELNLSQNTVTSLESLKDNININKIILPQNKIASLHGLENLKQLNYLDLQNNCLQDIIQYTDENNETQTTRNLSIVKVLNNSNEGKLNTLLLSGNSNLTDFSEIQNLSWSSKNGF